MRGKKKSKIQRKLKQGYKETSGPSKRNNINVGNEKK